MKLLGIDYGDSRTGFAVSDEMMFASKTLDALKEKKMDKVAEYAAGLAKELGVDRIVLGFPKNMNGTVGDRGKKTKQFKRLLESLSTLPVVLWDERLTTVSAHQIMNTTNVRGQKRKDRVDSMSAAILLQSYMDSLK